MEGRKSSKSLDVSPHISSHPKPQAKVQTRAKPQAKVQTRATNAAVDDESSQKKGALTHSIS